MYLQENQFLRIYKVPYGIAFEIVDDPILIKSPDSTTWMSGDHTKHTCIIKSEYEMEQYTRIDLFLPLFLDFLYQVFSKQAKKIQ